MVRRLRTVAMVVVVLGLAAAVAYALWPRPVTVESAVVHRGGLRVTVDEDGRTRIKERYVVSAPLAGRLARIALREGESVVEGETVIAVIEPTDPSLLDPRMRAEAEARVRAAQAALDRASAELARASEALELAQTELHRLREAEQQGGGSGIELARAEATARIRAEEARAAGFAREIAQYEVDLARAALLSSTQERGSAPEDWQFEIPSPVSGRVLRVIQKSEAVVNAGTPLVELGDPRDLEVIVDVLSSDAVAIRPGAEVSLEDWGGEEPIRGLVRLVEPAAFTKISALGVEEQRVNVVIDFAEPPEARRGLGDAYRVEARIVIWEGTDVLKAPAGAVFRDAESWAVFAIESGRAVLRHIDIGKRTGREVQALSGLEEGDRVVVYPGDRVRDGVRVRTRRP